MSHQLSRANFKKGFSPPPALADDEPVRWEQGMSIENTYWDEPLPGHKLDTKDKADQDLFPPTGIDLSDAWVIEIVRSNLTGVERAAKYPKVFASKGVVSNYVNKGRAAKVLISGVFYYRIAFNIVQFHGDEGRQERLMKDIPDAKITNDHTLDHGDRCIVQSNLYDYVTGLFDEEISKARAGIENVSATEQANMKTRTATREEKSLFGPSNSASVNPNEEWISNEEQAKAKTRPAATSERNSSSSTSVNPRAILIRDERTARPIEKQTKRAAISSRGSPASTQDFFLNDFKPVNTESRPTKKQRTVSTPTFSSLTPEENRAKEPAGKQVVSTMDGKPKENKATSEKKEKEEEKIAQLYYDEDSSDSSASFGNEENEAKGLRVHARRLEEKLDQAEAKFVMVTSHMERLHSSLQPLANRLREAHRLLHVCNDARKGDMKDRNKALKKLESLDAFCKESKEKVMDLLEVPNGVQDQMTRDFPETAKRIFLHEDNQPSEALLEWRSSESVNFNKISDADDLDVRGKLPRVSLEGSRLTELPPRSTVHDDSAASHYPPPDSPPANSFPRQNTLHDDSAVSRSLIPEATQEDPRSRRPTSAQPESSLPVSTSVSSTTQADLDPRPRRDELADAQMTSRENADFTHNLRIVQAPGRFPLIPNTISAHEAAVLANYRVPKKFTFPCSGFSVGRLNGVPYTMAAGRLEQNRRLRRPWDTPCYEGETRAVRKWEETWGLTFVPGAGMANPDPPKSFIVTNRDLVPR